MNEMKRFPDKRHKYIKEHKHLIDNPWKEKILKTDNTKTGKERGNSYRKMKRSLDERYTEAKVKHFDNLLK
jgi:hypothetical protein